MEGGNRDGTTKQAGIAMYPAIPSPSRSPPGARMPQIPAVWGLTRALWPVEV